MAVHAVPQIKNMTTKRKITAFRTKISLQMNHSYQKNTVSGKYNPLSEQGLKIRYLEIQSINGRNILLNWAEFISNQADKSLCKCNNFYDT